MHPKEADFRQQLEAIISEQRRRTAQRVHIRAELGRAAGLCGAGAVTVDDLGQAAELVEVAREELAHAGYEVQHEEHGIWACNNRNAPGLQVVKVTVEPVQA